MTVPTVTFVSLAAWAVYATALLAWQRRHCHRWHYGIGGGVAWDGQPPVTTTETATDGHDIAKAAS